MSDALVPLFCDASTADAPGSATQKPPLAAPPLAIRSLTHPRWHRLVRSRGRRRMFDMRAGSVRTASVFTHLEH